MKQKHIEMGAGLLVSVMNQCALIAIAVAIVGLGTGDKTYILLWIALGIIPIILQFVRINVESFFRFFGIHLIFPLIAVLLPVKSHVKIVAIVLVMIYVVTSVYIRIKKKSREEILYHPAFVFVILGIVTLFESFISQNGWEIYYIILAFFYLFIYFIHYFASRYLFFVNMNERTAANIPKGEIFNAGMKQTIVFAVGCLVLLTLSLNIEWLSYVSEWFLKVIRALVKALLSGATTEDEEDYDVWATLPGVPDLSGLPEGNSEPALIWLILEKVLIVLVVVLIVGGVVLVLVKGFNYLWQNFHALRPEKEKKTELSKDVRETLAVENTKKEGVKWFSFLDNRQKIRKIYHKYVLKNKTEIIGDYNQNDLEYMTAKECCDKISADKLQMIYEKARYTQEDISAEDVRAVKATLR